MKLKNGLIVFGTVVFSGFANAAGEAKAVDFSSLTGAVDFSSVNGAVLTVLAGGVTLILTLVGGRFVYKAIRGVS